MDFLGVSVDTSKHFVCGLCQCGSGKSPRWDASRSISPLPRPDYQPTFRCGHALKPLSPRISVVSERSRMFRVYIWLRAGFELYRAFPEDERRFAEFMRTKLPMPVLALAGDKSNGMTELTMARELANDARGGVAPETGHWLPDENPEFVAQQLLGFLPRPARR